MREQNVTDDVTDGGGEASATGNTLGYQDPITSNMLCILKMITIDNSTGANGRFLADIDSATVATVMGAVADIALEVPAVDTASWTAKDFGLKYITDGLVYQLSNAATGNGYKVTIEVDTFE